MRGDDARAKKIDNTVAMKMCLEDLREEAVEMGLKYPVEIIGKAIKELEWIVNFYQENKRY